MSHWLRASVFKQFETRLFNKGCSKAVPTVVPIRSNSKPPLFFSFSSLFAYVLYTGRDLIVHCNVTNSMRLYEPVACVRGTGHDYAARLSVLGCPWLSLVHSKSHSFFLSLFCLWPFLETVQFHRLHFLLAGFDQWLVTVSQALLFSQRPYDMEFQGEQTHPAWSIERADERSL